MAEQDNIQFSNRAIAAINAHDLDAYVLYIDDSYVGESETTGVVRGREGARQVVRMMLQAFPDLHIEVEETIESGNLVVIRALLTGTHRGSFAGVAPTNKTISWHGCNVLELRNGKVIRSRIYADNVDVLRQLGVLPMLRTTAA